MVRRRKRDIYGNWVWEDDSEIQTPNEKKTPESNARKRSTNGRGITDASKEDGEELSLDWRDFVALSIASLETFLLPIVVFILVLVGIVIGLTIFH